jgi:AraC-like DNA-binding protein
MIPSRPVVRPTTRLSTILTREEQDRVDAAGLGIYTSHHRREPMEVLGDVRGRTSSAVLISVTYCETERWNQVSRMIREISRIPTVAILSAESKYTVETLVKLGREGVRHVIDVRSAMGWGKLRRLLAEEHSDWLERTGMERLLERKTALSDECSLFFEALFKGSRSFGSVRRLAESVEILPSTLMSRFYRAGLPTPKQYLAIARLIRAAYLFENTGFSIANVANHLEYSSPQSFGRHIRGTMGMTALQFRRKYSGLSMFEMFEERLVEPYWKVLRWFKPFTGGAHGE